MCRFKDVLICGQVFNSEAEAPARINQPVLMSDGSALCHHTCSRWQHSGPCSWHSSMARRINFGAGKCSHQGYEQASM